MPENWKTYKLGEVAEVQNGFAFKSKDMGETGIPVIKIKNIVSPNVTLEGAGYYTGEIDAKLEKYILRRDDFLISMTGSTVNVMSSAVGKMGKYRLDDIALLNQRVGKIYITNTEKADFDYLCHFLNRYDINYNLALNATGSANQANISPAQIKDLKLLLPPLQEQKQIASILSALDDKIELNLQMNKTLEEMAMALYKHWFVDFGPFRDGEFVDSELGEIPKGWEVKTLEDEFKITIGRTPPRKEKEWFSSENGIKWISIKDMGNCGTYIFNTSEYLTQEAVVKKNVPQVPANTVILSFKLTVGRVAITTENMVSNEAIAHFLKKKNTLISAEYLYSALKSFDYNSLGSTSSIATAVNSKTVKSMKIIVPAKSVIDNFQEEIFSIFELIKTNSKEIQSLTQLRDTLLPKLISGEVRVKDVEKIVTEVL